MGTSVLLKYDKPADDFNQALPVGNGRIGGMVFGGTDDDIIKINEDSIWSGGLRNRVNPDALEGFAEVRALLAEGKVAEAEQVSFEKLRGVTPNMRRYMPLGDLNIRIELDGRAKDYSRSLDISEAISYTSFTVNDVTFTKEIFVSAPDEVMVVHISADCDKAVNLVCSIDGRDDYYDDNRPCGENMLLYTGGTGSSNGIFFAAAVGAMTSDGELRTLGGKLVVKNATDVTIVLSARTSFYGNNYKESAQVDAEMALKCEYDELHFRHVNDYKELFERVEFSLCDNSEADLDSMTTDERITRLKGDVLDNKECDRLIYDNKLIELYFNYGRYLMISASRPGTQPMNLQGIWNQDMSPVLGSRYTVNINTEMNYWIAESCNLAECHLPLFDLMERMCKNGRTMAKEMYGVKRGYVCHHNTDIWGDTAPQDMWYSSTVWPMGAAWLAIHVFEHYEYTLDRDFLENKYHLLKGAAEFFVGYLVEDKNGYLVTGPSVSPENTYLTTDGVKGSLCMGPSMDAQIITVLFNDVIKASKIIGKDKQFSDRLEKLLPKLPKPQIGKYGQIMEWAEDYDEAEMGHRHISQLFALYPADNISPYKTPKLADAARATLIRRLIHGGGLKDWSCAWVTNMWARLHDSRMVYENLKALLTHSTSPNLLNFHESFRVDANFGGTSAIKEALLQSCGGEINLLPALPNEWNSGYIKGIRAKGGFEVDIEWDDGKLKSASIFSNFDSECRLRANCVVSIVCEGESIDSRIEDGVIVFNAKKDSKYIVRT